MHSSSKQCYYHMVLIVGKCFFKHCVVQLNPIRHHSPECSLNATFNKQTNRARIQRSATCSNAAVTPMSLARLKLDASPPTPLPVQIHPPPTQLIALIHLTAAMIGESCSWYTTTRTSCPQSCVWQDNLGENCVWHLHWNVIKLSSKSRRNI